MSFFGPLLTASQAQQAAAAMRARRRQARQEFMARQYKSALDEMRRVGGSGLVWHGGKCLVLVEGESRIPKCGRVFSR